MLEIAGLSVAYGGLHALSDVSLRIGAGQFVAIVGPNGAGKTTLFKAISGTVAPAGGSIRFDGRDLLAVAPAARAHLGIAHVPEGRQVFASLSVQDNLEMGAYAARARPRRPSFERIFTLFPVLFERRHQLAGTLSGGEQQMLAIARTLMGNPIALLLDEPSEGLAPIVIQGITEVLHRLRGAGASILLAEQNMHFCLGIAGDATVIDKGQIVYRDTIGGLKANAGIRARYLAI